MGLVLNKEAVAFAPIMLQVLDCLAEHVGIVSESAEGCVADPAKETPDLAGFVAVVNVQTDGLSVGPVPTDTRAANCA